MSILIEIASKKAAERSGVTVDGRPWRVRSQKAYAHTFDGDTEQLNLYPVEMELRLKEDQLPYEPGFYMLSPTSFYTDKYSALAVYPRLTDLATYQKMVSSALNERAKRPAEVK